MEGLSIFHVEQEARVGGFGFGLKEPDPRVFKIRCFKRLSIRPLDPPTEGKSVYSTVRRSFPFLGQRRSRLEIRPLLDQAFHNVHDDVGLVGTPCKIPIQSLWISRHPEPKR